jgi:cobalt-zinc-cadmium efflux system outer membrane protein
VRSYRRARYVLRRVGTVPENPHRIAWMKLASPIALLIALIGGGVVHAQFAVESTDRAVSVVEVEAGSGELAHHDGVRVRVDSQLTLAEVVRLAGERDPGRVEVEARQAQGEALQRASRRWLAGAPSVFGIVVDDSVDNDDGYRQWDTGLQLPLWVPGQVAPRRRIAEAAGEAAVDANAVHALEVAGLVRAALGSLVLGEARRDRTHLDHDAELAFADRLEQAVELGEVAERELLLVRGGVLERELACFEASEALARAHANWGLITGLDRRPAVWREPPARGRSFEEHPQIRLARAEIEQAEATVERIERANWGNPSLTLGSQHERTSRGVDWDHRFVAGLQIPLGRADPVSSGAISARRDLAEARRSAGQIERTLRALQQQNEHRLELARRRVENTARHRLLATHHLDLVERGFALGEVDLPALMEARSEARGALWAEREAEIVRDILIGEVNQALGVIP